MKRKLISKALGLYTAPNQLTLPDGAMTTAANAVIDRNGVIQTRHGFDTLGAISTASRVLRLFSYKGYLFAHWLDNGGSYKLSYWGGSSWTTLTGTYTHPSPSNYWKIRTSETQGRLYFTTSTGVQKYSSIAGRDPIYAGAPKSIGFDRDTGTATPDVAGGILAPQTQVSYRSTIVYLDENSVEYEGSPSGWLILRNTNASGGSNKAPTVRCLLPKANGTTATALTTNYRLRLYRTSASVDLSTNPLEDEALVYEQVLTNTNITNGYVDIADVTPDSLRGAFLYTDPRQEGIDQANEPPPLAKEVVAFKGCMFYLNTISRQRMTLQLLSVDPTNGLKANETITIGGVTFTAKAAPAASGEYKLEASGGTISVSQAVSLTAQSLVGAINKHSSNTTVYAYYMEDPSDPRTVGLILLESRQPNASAIQPYVGATFTQACWEPQLPQSSGSANAQSTMDTWANGIYFSKVDQPDAVPLLNSLTRPGSQDKAVLKAIALRNALYIFKEDGIWRVVGEPPTVGNPGTFRLEEVSNTHTLLCPETAVTLNGEIWGWFDSGVLSISEGGIVPRSDAISDTMLLRMTTPGLTTIRKFAFAFSCDSDGRYILGAPELDAEEPRTFYVCNMKGGGAWTIWSRIKTTCGYSFSNTTLSTTNTLIYLGEYDANNNAKVYVERNDGSDSTYQDPNTTNFMDGTSIKFEVEYAPITLGDPGLIKHYIDVTCLIVYGANLSIPSTLTFVFESEWDGTLPITAYVGTPGNMAPLAAVCAVPDNVARSARLQVDISSSVSGFRVDICGLEVRYRTTPSRVTV